MSHVKNIIKILQSTDSKGRHNKTNFELAIAPLHEDAIENGLGSVELEALVKTFVVTDCMNLGATKIQRLICCFIPQTTVSDKIMRNLILWSITYMHKAPITVMKAMFMILIGYVENDLVDATSLKWSYEILFNGLTCMNLEAHTCRLLELLTTPDLVTRYRVNHLNSLQMKDKKKCFSSLLSLYKTLRPDKVPESFPVLSYSRNLSGDKIMMNAISRARERFNIMQDKSPEEATIHILNSGLNWSRQLHKRTSKKDNTKLIPMMNFHVSKAVTEENELHPAKLIVEHKTLEELGSYILTSQSPSQILSLLLSEPGIFYLQFAEEAVKQRFRLTLFHTLMNVLDGRDRNHYQVPVVKELLEAMHRMQEVHLCGSAVVTRFIAQFLQLQANEELLPEVLKLMTRLVFSSYEELYTSILIFIEQLFCSSDVETKVLILKAVGDLILNLHWKAHWTAESENLDWNPETTLQDIGMFYNKLCCIAVASYKPSKLILLFMEGLRFYHLLVEVQVKVCKFNLWTVPSIHLMLGCLLSSQSFLVESSCELLLKHRSELNGIHKFKSRLFKNQISQINVIATNYATVLTMSDGMFIPDTSPCLLLKHVTPECTEKLKQVLEDRVECLDVGTHPAFTSARLYIQKETQFVLTVEDMEAMCKDHFPNTYNLVTLFRGDDSEEGP